MDCRYWERGEPFPNSGPRMGECRRYPPEPKLSHFPTMTADDWCGEHRGTGASCEANILDYLRRILDRLERSEVAL